MNKLILCIFALLISACSSAPKVQVWQKGDLAKSSMALQRDPLKTRFQTHLYESKEAANGRHGVGGGGCGCN